MGKTDVVFQKQDIRIYTLGKFSITQGELIISENSSRSSKMWELFKYLLSHRNQSFLPETILEYLRPDKDYRDPNTAMRAQTFRLRHALNLVTGSAQSLSENIIFTQGCYRWEDRAPCWIDVIQFEALANEAKTLAGVNADASAAMDLYRKAIAHYQGDYLPELSFNEWVEPLRSYYRDIYLHCVLTLIELLKSKHAYADIIELCERAAVTNYFEEKIHIQMIEALLKENQTDRARAHYNNVTSRFYREMGVKPSDEMKNLYRLVGAQKGGFELDLTTIQEGLKSRESTRGVYFCDCDLFKYFYKLERLKSERSSQLVLLCLLTVSAPDYSVPETKTLQAVMRRMQDIISNTLRKGDLATRWNEAQFLFLLPGLNREQAARVMTRIEKAYLLAHSLEGLVLHKKVETLMPLEDDSHFG
ncbi:MAG TPA: BTAD domain-containing putative transcriptional regulator [Candidatus Limnocylindrales bacterium]|nr:BTAD domain-containing putative transcriptional regulator [Candidatus Limnocylindrales bacterium]